MSSSAIDHFNEGNRLADLGRQRDAVEQYRQALALERNYPSAWYNLGIAHDELLEMHASEHAYRAALEIEPELAEAHVNLAFCLLKQGRFAEAWPEYEWRYHPNHPPANSARLPSLRKPRWTGQDIAGRTLLLTPEQGLGDTIQFCRYASTLRAMGARTLITARPELVDLLSGARAVDRVIALGEPFAANDYDYWTLPLSLPGVLRTTLESIPAQIPYLNVDPQKGEAWSARLSHLPARLRVGIAWSGSARHPNDARRSIPAALFAEALDCPDATFVSLQVPSFENDLGVLRAHSDVFDAASGLHDFSETAALMQSLDLIVTADSSPAHLAGALGRPTWILLPFNADWRWLLDRTDSPWYPTARLFRQAQPGDWAGVLREVRTALAQYATGR